MASCVQDSVPRYTDEQLEILTESASEPVRTLAAELLATRRGLCRVGGLLAFYSEEHVQQAWKITRELRGEET